ncbi:MAG: hypothetical protein E4H23_08565 [Chrysiogenales bacterium]|nr:MAG: hypothetical protein E4H23_08565 [Chrysiogenales bacterium]
MHKNLEIYLEEISHFLSGRGEREEILSEIRSHILEKAEQEAGPVSEASLEKVIAAYGKPRLVAEKYLEGRPVIAPAFKRLLFRYTALLFAIHLIFIVFAVIFKKSFIVFPFLFVPRMGLVEAVMYLPAAFLTDFGIVALVLYFITQSGSDFKLPWPKFALDLDEVKAPAAKTLAARIWTMVGAGIMLALTGVAIKLFIKFKTIFFVSFNFEKFRPLLMPAPGRLASLAVLAMMAAGTIALFIKLFPISRRFICWVDAAADAIALVMIGVLLRQQHTNLFAVRIPTELHSWLHITLTVTLFIAALLIAIDLVRNLVRLGRKHLVG